MRQRGPIPDDKSAYHLYNGGGRELGYQEMLDRCVRSDVILFGEIHEHPLVHWLQLELTRDLFEIRKGDLVLGAEMLEADNQLIVDEYLAGLIGHEHVVTVNARGRGDPGAPGLLPPRFSSFFSWFSLFSVTRFTILPSLNH